MLLSSGSLLLAVACSILIRPSTSRPQNPPPSQKCDSIQNGYNCEPEISHLWGQYSPYYSVQSEISPNIPPGCDITFAQILSRHGARYPSTKKTKKYGKTVSKLQKNVRSFKGNYKFLETYDYALGAEQLTAFGVQEMVNSGTEFYERYADLAKIVPKGPFVRASGQQRVGSCVDLENNIQIDSATHFTSGFHTARASTAGSDPADYPYEVVVISEYEGSNNTISSFSCPAFDDTKNGKKATKAIRSEFISPIKKRLNTDLGINGFKLSAKKVIYLMDMCPFDTVASPTGAVSPFCSLFTASEFAQYDYRASVSKYYGYGKGNPLGPTQGVGFVNELIARLTEQPVQDHTTVNQTLNNNATFPLDRRLYADFGHDDGITSIMFALGLFNDTTPLSTKKIETVDETSGYTAARTVPFASRMYVEKMQCSANSEELVRVIVNGRVIPLDQCSDVDELGRCGVSEFVKTLSFAQEGGKWDECAADGATQTATLQKGNSTSGIDDDDDDDDDDDENEDGDDDTAVAPS